MPSIDLTSCDFCVWGFKNSYNTFGHIFAAFERALKFKYPDRQIRWLDEQDDIAGINFENTFFIGMHMAIKGIPRLKSCAYAIHNTDPETKEYFKGYFLLNYGLYVSTMDTTGGIELARDTYVLPQPWESYSAAVFRWGTDLLPDEIEANKPDRVFREDSRVVNYIGSGIAEVEPFKQACADNGITFNAVGGFNRPTVTIEDNVRLIKESSLAPAISNEYHCSVGYIPCRVYKNLSYGQVPITNNQFTRKAFSDIVDIPCNPDTHQLFYDAKEYLSFFLLGDLWRLMDDVAKNHTYLNKIDALLQAAKIAQEVR